MRYALLNTAHKFEVAKLENACGLSNVVIESISLYFRHKRRKSRKVEKHKKYNNKLYRLLMYRLSTVAD